MNKIKITYYLIEKGIKTKKIIMGNDTQSIICLECGKYYLI